MQITCKEDPDRLYFSDNIIDIIKFYYCFNDACDLIKWSRSRPLAEINIVEKEGDSEIVFIVPTPDIIDKLTISLLEFIKNFLGIPIKLLVVDDYKGYGGRYFFSINVNDTAEDNYLGE